MDSGYEEDVTELLQQWGEGCSQARDQLIPVLYAELHGLARGYFHGEQAGVTLQPTALVHEVYLRLIDQRRIRWQNRVQFFAVAARLMRRILVDHARRRKAQKRGGDATRITLGEGVEPAVYPGELDLIELDGALEELASFEPRQSRIVELRFFAGLTVEETARIENLSPATVKREWSTARAWLFQRVQGS
ncbi:MAG: sigma-70 family RNA polymerase sigma factor [Acidobacteriota bacterium]